MAEKCLFVVSETPTDLFPQMEQEKRDRSVEAKTDSSSSDVSPIWRPEFTPSEHQNWEEKYAAEYGVLQYTPSTKIFSPEETAEILKETSAMRIKELDPESYKKFKDFFSKHKEETKAYRMELEKNTRQYDKLVGATEGFDVGPWSMWSIEPRPGGLTGGSTWNPEALAAAKFALKTLDLSLVKLICVNQCLMSYPKYFLTMEASDGKFYEAKAQFAPDGKLYELYFIRPAKYYPRTKALVPLT